MSETTSRYIFNNEFKNILVKDLINTKTLKSCDVITTEQGLLNIVKNATVMDVEDIDQWVHEGEVLTISSKFINTCFTNVFINKLFNKKIACIVTKKKLKKFITKENYDLLKEYNLPIIFIDDDLAWSDIIVTVQDLIIQNQTYYLKENQNFQTSIINYLSDHYSANSLCYIVHNLTGITVAIADHNLKIIDCSEDNDWKYELQNLTKRSLVNLTTIGENFNEVAMRGYSYKDCSINTEDQYFIVPDKLLNRFMANFYIIIKYKGDATYLPSRFIGRIETIESIFSLKRSIKSAFKKSNYYFKSVIFEELLEMDHEDETKKNQISLSLNAELNNKYYLILIKDFKNDTICKNVDLLAGFIDYIKHKGFYNENFLIFIYKENWIFLIDDSVQSIKEICTNIYDSLIMYFENQQFKIGISNVYNYWNLKHAFKEAQFAMNFIKNNKNKNKSILMYNELGIIKLFTDENGQINSVYINEMFQNYLRPLLIYDENHSADLYNTLVSFLSNDLSLKITSENLFIHVNSLRARLKKIEEVININLNNIDSIVNLRITTLLYQFGYFSEFI